MGHRDSKSRYPSGRHRSAGRSTQWRRCAHVQPMSHGPAHHDGGVARREGFLVRLVDGIANRRWLCGFAPGTTERLVLIDRDGGRRTGCAVGGHESYDGTLRRMATGSCSDRLVGGPDVEQRGDHGLAERHGVRMTGPRDDQVQDEQRGDQRQRRDPPNERHLQHRAGPVLAGAPKPGSAHERSSVPASFDAVSRGPCPPCHARGMTKRVLIAGASVAAVEAVLALRHVAGGTSPSTSSPRRRPSSIGRPRSPRPPFSARRRLTRPIWPRAATCRVGAARSAPGCGSSKARCRRALGWPPDRVAGRYSAACQARARPPERAQRGCSSSPAPPRVARINWTDDRVAQRAEG